jgi:hypothetical protein
MTSSGVKLSAGNLTIPAGTTSAAIDLLGESSLPSGTQRYAPMSIAWSVGVSDTLNASCAQASCAPAGTSASDVYVTMATPNKTPLPLTVLGLAVGNGGAATLTGAFRNTWARFSTSNGVLPNVTAWDNKALYYYTPNQGFDACATNSDQLLFLTQRNGQCGSFAYLLQDAVEANGISMDFVTIDAFAGNQTLQILVKNWVFGGADPLYAPFSWPLALEAEPGGYSGMVPLPVGSIFGQMISLAGIAGQNTPQPSEKVFLRHFILKDVMGVSGAGPYYDPSYGVTYLNACDPQDGFEHKSVDGYALKIPVVDVDPNFHARKVDTNSCNIRFDK